MNIRAIALGGVVALALCGPAVASDATGWYLGLGAGWDRLGNFQTKFQQGGPTETIGTDNSVLLTGSFGYRMPLGLRLEAEFGWSKHDIHGANNVFTGTDVGGNISNLTG